MNPTPHYSNTGAVTPPPKVYEIERPTIKFNLKTMERICLAPIESFTSYGEMTGVAPDRYFFADHGSNVLAVAHLDSVEQHKHFVVAKVAGETIVYNAQLDDRLGAYIILELLPRLGIQCDILLTEGEETGRSTAKHFTSAKQYNWIISFDRMGTDVVMYKYETPKYAQMLRESDCRVGVGSFSDICYLESLGCAGFNFGCGYADYHSKLARVELSDTAQMIQSFLDFHKKHKDTFLEHKKRDSYTSRHGTTTTTTPTNYSSTWEYDDYDFSRPNHHNRSTGGRTTPPPDDRELCSICEKRVDPVEYVYGQSCCFPCLKAFMRACEEDSRITLDEIGELMKLEGWG